MTITWRLLHLNVCWCERSHATIMIHCASIFIFGLPHTWLSRWKFWWLNWWHDVQRFLINELMFGFNYVDAVAMTYHCCPVVEHSFETKPLKHSIDKFVVNTSIWNSYATAMYTFQEKASKYGKSNVNIDIAYLHNNTTHTSTAQNSCLTCSILVTHV